MGDRHSWIICILKKLIKRDTSNSKDSHTQRAADTGRERKREIVGKKWCEREELINTKCIMKIDVGVNTSS